MESEFSRPLAGVVDGLEQLDSGQLQDIARELAEGCTISLALRESIKTTHDIKAAPAS